MRIAKISVVSSVSILMVACILVGCVQANSVRQDLAPSTATLQSARQTTPSPTAILKVLESPTWTLYQEPHHYFFLEYPSDWQVDPGEPPLSDSPIWSFFGLLVTSPITQEIEIARDTLPIHPSQTIEAWRFSQGPGERAATLVEQRTFQLNGREIYFTRSTLVPHDVAQTTYFRCGTWVWVVSSIIDDTTVAEAEFDVIYEHVVNTFIPKCY